MAMQSLPKDVQRLILDYTDSWTFYTLVMASDMVSRRASGLALYQAAEDKMELQTVGDPVHAEYEAEQAEWYGLLKQLHYSGLCTSESLLRHRLQTIPRSFIDTHLGLYSLVDGILDRVHSQVAPQRRKINRQWASDRIISSINPYLLDADLPSWLDRLAESGMEAMEGIAKLMTIAMPAQMLPLGSPNVVFQHLVVDIEYQTNLSSPIMSQFNSIINKVQSKTRCMIRAYVGLGPRCCLYANRLPSPLLDMIKHLFVQALQSMIWNELEHDAHDQPINPIMPYDGELFNHSSFYHLTGSPNAITIYERYLWHVACQERPELGTGKQIHNKKTKQPSSYRAARKKRKVK